MSPHDSELNPMKAPSIHNSSQCRGYHPWVDLSRSYDWWDAVKEAKRKYARHRNSPYSRRTGIPLTPTSNPSIVTTNHTIDITTSPLANATSPANSSITMMTSIVGLVESAARAVRGAPALAQSMDPGYAEKLLRHHYGTQQEDLIKPPKRRRRRNVGISPMTPSHTDMTSNTPKSNSRLDCNPLCRDEEDEEDTQEREIVRNKISAEDLERDKAYWEDLLKGQEGAEALQKNTFRKGQWHWASKPEKGGLRVPPLQKQSIVW